MKSNVGKGDLQSEKATNRRTPNTLVSSEAGKTGTHGELGVAWAPPRVPAPRAGPSAAPWTPDSPTGCPPGL